MEVNVYDFDKTIFHGDSTKKFYMYLLKRQPKLLLQLPKQGIYTILFYFKVISKTFFKQKFYGAFKHVNNIQQEVLNFWEQNSRGIKKWYLQNKQPSDIIISASPEFLLKPICEKLEIKYLIASIVNPFNGEYTGLNCYGEEKVRRLEALKKDFSINQFYSDSFSDEPLAKLAKESYLVVNDDLYLWWEYKKGEKIKK